MSQEVEPAPQEVNHISSYCSGFVFPISLFIPHGAKILHAEYQIPWSTLHFVCSENPNNPRETRTILGLRSGEFLPQKTTRFIGVVNESANEYPILVALYEVIE